MHSPGAIRKLTLILLSMASTLENFPYIANIHIAKKGCHKKEKWDMRDFPLWKEDSQKSRFDQLFLWVECLLPMPCFTKVNKSTSSKFLVLVMLHV